MDTPQVIIIFLSLLTAAVWVDSLLFDRHDERENQPKERTAPIYHGEAMLGVEEF
jgi:hypothetical protein